MGSKISRTKHGKEGFGVNLSRGTPAKDPIIPDDKMNAIGPVIHIERNIVELVKTIDIFFKNYTVGFGIIILAISNVPLLQM